MSEQEKAEQIHDLLYSTESRTEMCERVVALEEENAKLKEERDHWCVEQVHAYGNWEDAYKRATELEAENAKLREERDTYRDLVDCMVHPDIPDQLAAENARLRELVQDMWFWHYEGHIDSESQERQMLHIDAVIQRMRELGIEVKQ